MTTPDYSDHWRRYWERRHDSGRRMELVQAATDPVGRWVTADVRELVEDEVGFEREPLYDDPDEVLDAARAGFEEFAGASDLGPPDVGGYDALPVHLTGVTEREAPLTDPLADANAITAVDGVPGPDSVRRAPRPAIVTYRCPRGHETTLPQRLYRTWTIDACGRPDCTNGVVLDDRQTAVRRVIEFTVDHGDRELRCVATGRYASDPDVYERIAGADRLSLTGIARVVVTDAGEVDPVYELLHAEPA